MDKGVLVLRNKGFTLIEVMMAMSILGVVILGMSSTMGGMVHMVAVSQQKAAALALVDSRLSEIEMEPNYSRLDSAYAGTEANLPSLPGATRKTTVVHVGGPGQPVDYVKISVSVQAAGLVDPISRTISVAAP